MTAMPRFYARAPVRVDPAGGGTDAPPFCTEHGGCVVNFAVQRYMFASVQRLPADQGIVIRSFDQGKSITAESAAGLPVRGEMEFLAAFVRRLVPADQGLLLETDSDIPPGSGLGGSGALGVAVVAALDAAFAGGRSPEAIAALANSVERDDLGYAGGSQDSYGAAVGGVNRIDYHPDGGVTVNRLQIDTSTRLALEHRSLLIYTGEAHLSRSIHRDILHSYHEPDSPTLAAMRQLRATAQAMADALTAGRLAQYAEMLTEACRGLYALHPSCDSPVLQRFYEAVGDSVLGGKTCGAGGGGYLVVFTRRGRRRDCIRRAESAGGKVEPVQIDWHGVQTWCEG